MMNKFGHQGGF
jgi:hypothetical protein